MSGRQALVLHCSDPVRKRRESGKTTPRAIGANVILKSCEDRQESSVVSTEIEGRHLAGERATLDADAFKGRRQLGGEPLALLVIGQCSGDDEAKHEYAPAQHAAEERAVGVARMYDLEAGPGRARSRYCGL